MIAPRKPAPELAGTVLEGAYRLVRLIGQGGMGAVYEAVQLRLNKRVAIKLMSQSAVSDQVSLARFHREAEVTSKLGHPHLVNVVDFGTAESGQPYMVMEYLEGEDLDHRLRRCKRLTPEIAARIVAQTASALGAAHAQDVVHRDMKPGNIFLLQVPGEPEFVKVLDFGISKIKASNVKRLTSDRMVVGTPLYMSPEQATGRADDIDHHADQWALACIAWEMLCGHPPFVSDDVTAVMYQITRLEPPSLLKEVPGLRPDAEEVLRRALCKRHVNRYPSIREFAREFESAVLGYPAELTPPPGLIPVYGGDASALAGQAQTPGPVSDAMPGPRPVLITAKISRLRVPRWPVLVGAGVLLSILIVLGIVRTRTPAASSAAPKALVSSPAQAAVVPLPPKPAPVITALPASESPITTAEPPSTPPKRAKSKSNKDLGARPQPASKPRPTPVKTQHRLFEKL